MLGLQFLAAIRAKIISVQMRLASVFENLGDSSAVRSSASVEETT